MRKHHPYLISAWAKLKRGHLPRSRFNRMIDDFSQSQLRPVKDYLKPKRDKTDSAKEIIKVLDGEITPG